MKEKVMPKSTSPSLEEVLKTILELLENHFMADWTYPCFSSPIELDEQCVQCGSTFVTEIYATGTFACLECGKLLQGQ